MTTVFADTFYFLALMNPRDQAHARAVAYTASFQGRMLTTAWVLAEYGDAMSDPRNRQEFVATLRGLRNNPQMTIVAPDLVQFEGVLLSTKHGRTRRGR